MRESIKITLTYLINYTPKNDTERLIYKKLNTEVLFSYLNDTNSKYFGGSFYLGGQLRMKPDEEITLKKIDEVKEISKQRLIEYGYANGLEVASIGRSKSLLNQLEEIIKFHLKLAYLDELEKTELNNDVNHHIVSFI